jgi:response regulator RpfG family c-di-GMP phosphodiesterase
MQKRSPAIFPGAMTPLHILITDDDTGKLMFLSRGMRLAFPRASIFECRTGKEALEYCKSNHVDALITDHSMFPVNGIELV